jgi:hypothetical protein
MNAVRHHRHPIFGRLDAHISACARVAAMLCRVRINNSTMFALIKAGGCHNIVREGKHWR